MDSIKGRLATNFAESMDVKHLSEECRHEVQFLNCVGIIWILMNGPTVEITTH